MCRPVSNSINLSSDNYSQSVHAQTVRLPAAKMYEDELMTSLIKLLPLCAVLALPVFADDDQTITVTGSGAVALTPSHARLTVAFASLQSDVAVGKKLVDEQSAAYAKVLAQHDINSKDINNAPLVVYPQQNEQKLDQFRVERSTTVLIRDLSLYPKLLEAAAKLRVSQIYPVELQVADADKAYKEALSQAFAVAQEKAALLAKLSGRKLAGVKQVQELSNAPAPRMKDMMMAAEGMSVSFGNQQVRADVQIQYSFTPAGL